MQWSVVASVHGLMAQRSFFVWQNSPVKPSGHWQVKESIPSWQVPPLRQGVPPYLVQSSGLMEQSRPNQPGGQQHCQA
jgi:hypothetical protein